MLEDESCQLEADAGSSQLSGFKLLPSMRSQHSDTGYLIHERVFEQREMARVLKALSAIELTRSKGGARHVLSLPAVRALASDPRLISIAARFIGPGPIPFRATLFDKSPAANWLVTWHQDPALPLRARIVDSDWGPWSVKAGVLYAHAPAWALERVVALRVHLDDSSADNGPLRVIPNSHRQGRLTSAAIVQLTATTVGVECLSSSGGVVAMRPLIVHASSKSAIDAPRRVLHIEYVTDTQLAPGIELAVA